MHSIHTARKFVSNLLAYHKKNDNKNRVIVVGTYTNDKAIHVCVTTSDTTRVLALCVTYATPSTNTQPSNNAYKSK